MRERFERDAAVGHFDVGGAILPSQRERPIISGDRTDYRRRAKRPTSPFPAEVGTSQPKNPGATWLPKLNLNLIDICLDDSLRTHDKIAGSAQPEIIQQRRAETGGNNDCPTL